MTLSKKSLLKAFKKTFKLKQQKRCKHKNKDYFSTDAETTIYCKRCKKILSVFWMLPDNFFDDITRKKRVKVKKPHSSNLPLKPLK